jgi:hypothetical protein
VETPIGFATLHEAVDMFRKVLGSSKVKRTIAVKPTIAEACEAGKIAAAYRNRSGGTDQLDCSVWRMPHWRSYFETGTIDLDLPLVDDSGRPHPRFTARCTREIFVRRDSLARFVGELEAAEQREIERKAADAAAAAERERLRIEREAKETAEAAAYERARLAQEKVDAEPPRCGGRPGRKPKARELIKDEVIRLMEHHGPFSPDDPEWDAQARLEEAITNFLREKGIELAKSTVRENVILALNYLEAKAGN